MKTFKDIETGDFWQFDEDVQVRQEEGKLSIYTVSGQFLDIPPTLMEAELELPGGDSKTPIPKSVSRYQARAALLEAGFLAQVEAHFMGLPDSSLERLAWQEAPTVHRDSDALASAATALGLTSDQVDALFVRASEFI